jgi:flagellar biosynthetic protein FliQ
MSEAAFLDLLKETLMLILLLSSPVLIVAMGVGLLVSLIQSVTQIQESTLTFVPKILASMVILVVASPWMLSVFMDHTERLLRHLSDIVQY